MVGPCRWRRWSAALAITGTVAAFSDSTDNASNTVTAAPDFVAPQVSSAVVAKTPGYDALLRQAGGHLLRVRERRGRHRQSRQRHRVCHGELEQLRHRPVGGRAHGRLLQRRRCPIQLPQRVARRGQPAHRGRPRVPVTATDTASNASTFNGALTVDNTAPTAADVQTANGGTVAGRPELSDTVTFTYSEPIDPESILTGWTGAQTDVTVRVNNGGQGNDSLLVYNPANTAQLPLGTVNLGRTDYVSANRTFGATGPRRR